MRRGILHDMAKQQGCGKLALGHHLDDAAETFLMNLFDGAALGSFSPVTYLSRKDLTLIRPMIFAREADIARAVFEAANGNGEKVVPVSTADYYASAAGPIAPRPVHSALDLSRLESVGFHMPDWEEELGEYLKTL